jgi:hypothetical protein
MNPDVRMMRPSPADALFAPFVESWACRASGKGDAASRIALSETVSRMF